MNKTDEKNFYNITNFEEFKDLGLVLLKDWKGKDGPSRYIQLCDPKGLLDDGEYTCHYEILYYMGKETSEYGKHKNGNIYVEIHFENSKYSPYFESIVTELGTKTELECFLWRKYCPGLRIKNIEFTINDAKKILKNLKDLAKLTLPDILKTYTKIKEDEEGWKPDFKLSNGGSERNKKRALTAFSREPKEILVIHEAIKDRLIGRVKGNPGLIDKKDPIVISSLSPENPVNKINFIDLAAKTKSGKIIFFEIKTVYDARLCIRQALGQLMEYSFFPETHNAQKLVVVGPVEKTPEVITYLERLNKDFNIPIGYIQIKPNKKEIEAKCE